MKVWQMLAPVAALVLLPSAAAEAMTLKDCSVRYQEAKKAGTLNGQNWSDFRAAQCGLGPMVRAAAAASATGTSPAVTPAAAAAPAMQSAPAPAVPDGLVLPSAIDPRYAAEKPSRARLHTCADAYRTLKKSGGLKGLRWIQKGGGFYSLCCRRLKAGG